MPHFVNRDQIFAHQVHLLEHKLRVSDSSDCSVTATSEGLKLRDTASSVMPVILPENSSGSQGLKSFKESDQVKLPEFS